MESINKHYINNGSYPNSSSDKIHCSICKQQFDDMAKMQRHAMIEHMNKGEISKGKEK
jgi:stress-induced morphogen